MVQPDSPLSKFFNNLNAIGYIGQTEETINDLIESIKNITINLPSDLAERKVLYNKVIGQERKIKQIGSKDVTVEFEKFKEVAINIHSPLQKPNPESLQPAQSLTQPEETEKAEEEEIEEIEEEIDEEIEEDLPHFVSNPPQMDEDEETKLTASIPAKEVSKVPGFIKVIQKDREVFKNSSVYKLYPTFSEEEKIKWIEQVYNNIIYLLGESEKLLEEGDRIPLKELKDQLIFLRNNFKTYSNSSRESLFDRVLNAPVEQFLKPFSNLLFHPAYRPGADSSDLEVEFANEDEKLEFLIRGPDKDKKFFICTLSIDRLYSEIEYANLYKLLVDLPQMEKLLLLKNQTVSTITDTEKDAENKAATEQESKLSASVSTSEDESEVSLTPYQQFWVYLISIRYEKSEEYINKLINIINDLTENPPIDSAKRDDVYKKVINAEKEIKGIGSKALTDEFDKFKSSYDPNR